MAVPRRYALWCEAPLKPTSPLQYFLERRKAIGAPDRFLSTSSFTLENLEGVPAPRNR
jgi:hypothetical protein